MPPKVLIQMNYLLELQEGTPIQCRQDLPDAAIFNGTIEDLSGVEC